MNKKLLISLIMLVGVTSIGTFSFMIRGQDQDQAASGQMSPEEKLLTDTFSLLKNAREELESAISDLTNFAARAGKKQQTRLGPIIKKLRTAKDELSKYNPAR